MISAGNTANTSLAASQASIAKSTNEMYGAYADSIQFNGYAQIMSSLVSMYNTFVSSGAQKYYYDCLTKAEGIKRDTAIAEQVNNVGTIQDVKQITIEGFKRKEDLAKAEAMNKLVKTKLEEQNRTKKASKSTGASRLNNAFSSAIRSDYFYGLAS